MAEFNGNNPYLTMNGVDVTARWREIEVNMKFNDIDVSAGAGIVWEKHAAGLANWEGKIILVYDDTQAATDFAALWTANHEVEVIYGPEGNTAGKPCHQQDVVIIGMTGPKQVYNKPLVMIEFDIRSRDEPTKNIFEGDTF